MPIFENKGVKYDVSPEYIPDFASASKAQKSAETQI